MRLSSLRQSVSAVTTLATLWVGIATATTARGDDPELSIAVANGKGSVRLLVGPSSSQGAVLTAGVEIRLAPGWKTYWRHPGDAGIAPRFDTSGSTNLASAVVSFPAPLRFDDGGGIGIGYAGRVIFPLRIERIDPEKPVALALAIDFAVCEKLCVPASATLAATLPGQSAHGTMVASALARVPRRVALAEGTGLAIRAVRREGEWPHPRVIVDVVAPPETTVDLFAEGPGPDWALPVPEATDDAPVGTRRFAFVLEGAPPGTEPRGVDLVLTAVARSATPPARPDGQEAALVDAIEVPVRLD